MNKTMFFLLWLVRQNQKEIVSWRASLLKEQMKNLDLIDASNELQEKIDELEDQKATAYYVRDQEILARKRAESKLYELQAIISEIEFKTGVRFNRMSVADQSRLLELLQEF